MRIILELFLNLKKYIYTFLVNWWKEISSILFCLVFAYLFLGVFLPQIVDRLISLGLSQKVVFLRTFITYSIVVLLSYISFPKLRNLVGVHKEFFTVLTILIPVALLLFQITIESLDSIINSETFLREENSRNIDFLKEIINNLENKDISFEGSNNVMFWRDFSVENYSRYWSYISRNYPQECKNYYAAVTIQLNAMNNANSQRRELNMMMPNFLVQGQIIRANEVDAAYRKFLLDAAMGSQILFSDIVEKCQK